MGSAKHRSWSHSRGQRLAECPRAFYWQYYPWGDELQDPAAFLKNAHSPKSLAGVIVHRHMNDALRQMAKGGAFQPWIAKHAASEYDDAVRSSWGAARRYNAGTCPPKVPVLHHHIEEREDRAAEEEGRHIVESSLGLFESSRMHTFLQSTNRRRWLPILHDQDPVPSFEAKKRLGFDRSVGLKIFAAYDFRLRVGDDLVIVDWKTGTRTEWKEAAARRQLAVYALHALSGQATLGRVRVVAHWLGEDSPWEPIAISREEIEATVARIEADDAAENALITRVADVDGVFQHYAADRETFEARPEPRRCGMCAFRSLCEEGGAVNTPQAEPSTT